VLVGASMVKWGDFNVVRFPSKRLGN
jgi:hypothetical protein